MDLWDYFYDSINGIEINYISAIYRLLLGMVLGAVVGYERRVKGQSAGVRTFSLIAMGATLAMILSIYVPQEYLGLKNGDPGRIAAQVVTGVGFLGAGAIIQMKGSVRGLTTAAGIWMVAALGMAVGVGMYVVSIVATLLILFILIQLERIEKYFSSGAESRIVRVSANEIIEDVEPYRAILAEHHIDLTSFYIDYDYANNISRLNLVVLAHTHPDYIALFKQMRRLYPTLSISLANQL